MKGKAPKETAALRTAEAEKACAILKARPLFAGQTDGSTEVNAARYDEFAKLLGTEKPDVVFTHWPVDSHRDHRVTSLLVYDGPKWIGVYESIEPPQVRDTPQGPAAVWIVRE